MIKMSFHHTVTKPASNPAVGDGDQLLVIQTDLPESPVTEG